jgi:hypothetical protein
LDDLGAFIGQSTAVLGEMIEARRQEINLYKSYGVPCARFSPLRFPLCGKKTRKTLRNRLSRERALGNGAFGRPAFAVGENSANANRNADIDNIVL